MIKKITTILALFILTLLMSSCVGNIVKTEKDELLLKSIAELHHEVEEEEWDTVRRTMAVFQEDFAKRKWKLQLLAAKDDYQDIELEFQLLKENVKDKDQVESLVRIRQIHYRLTTIYRM